MLSDLIKHSQVFQVSASNEPNWQLPATAGIDTRLIEAAMPLNCNILIVQADALVKINYLRCNHFTRKSSILARTTFVYKAVIKLFNAGI